jgi:hypothetical protein
MPGGQTRSRKEKEKKRKSFKKKLPFLRLSERDILELMQREV